MDMDRDQLIKSIKENMSDDEKREKIEQAASSLKGKSDDEIFVEIFELNKEMESKLSPDKYNEVLGKLEQIRPMLSEAQNEKLDKVLDALGKKE